MGLTGKPRAVILGGINGAGKTTAARALLADTLGVTTFVNADTIAQGINGFDPESVALEAGRILLDRLDSLVTEGADVAVETTLAARSYANWVKTVTEKGYTTHLHYFWLASADLAVARVAARVASGGHDIPGAVIRRRYGRSLRNLFELYLPLVTTWKVYDNTFNDHRQVAEGGTGRELSVYDDLTWQAIRAGAEQ